MEYYNQPLNFTLQFFWNIKAKFRKHLSRNFISIILNSMIR